MEKQKINRETAAKEAEEFAWDARRVPEEFEPVQSEWELPVTCCDWWNVRSKLFCFVFPIMGCISGHKTYDADDAEAWREVAMNPSNPHCPDDMKGVWWFKYNHAHEQLVTVFGDSEFDGDFGEDGNGMGTWTRKLQWNYSRDRSCFGLVMASAGKCRDNSTLGKMNLQDGICTIRGPHGNDTQVIYKINDNEWWKVHYMGKIGEEGFDDIEMMYKWIKVIDGDGNKTEHWDEWVESSKKPLPHRNCCEPWFPLWSCCLGKREVVENMFSANKKQVIRFKRN